MKHIKWQGGKALIEDRFVESEKETGFIEYGRVLGMFVDLDYYSSDYRPCEFRPIEPWPEVPESVKLRTRPDGVFTYDANYIHPYIGLGYLIITNHGPRWESVNGERHPQEGMENNV